MTILKWVLAVTTWIVLFYGFIGLFGGAPNLLVGTHGFWVLFGAAFCAYAPAVSVVSKFQLKLPMVTFITLTLLSSQVFDFRQAPSTFVLGSLPEMMGEVCYSPLGGGFVGAYMSSALLGIIRFCRRSAGDHQEPSDRDMGE